MGMKKHLVYECLLPNLNYYSLVASNNLAKERQTSFYEFEESTYASGAYFEKYINEDWSPKTDKVKYLLYHFPTRELRL